MSDFDDDDFDHDDDLDGHDDGSDLRDSDESRDDHGIEVHLWDHASTDPPVGVDDNEPDRRGKPKIESEKDRIKRQKWTTRDLVVSLVGVTCFVCWDLSQPRQDGPRAEYFPILMAVVGIFPLFLARNQHVYYSRIFRAGRWLWFGGLFVPWAFAWLFHGRPFWGHSLPVLLFVYILSATYLFFRGFWAIVGIAAEMELDTSD